MKKVTFYILLGFAFIFPAIVSSAEIKDIYTIVFILDGTPKDLLYSEIENGNLKNIKDLFWDNGAHSISTMTTFPASSAPAYQSFITGLFAGHAGIPYLQWFDRISQKSVDYLGLDYLAVDDHLWSMRAMLDPNVIGDDYPITIFDKLQGKNHLSASIYSEVSKGATIKNPINLFGALSDVFLTVQYENMDMRATKKLMKAFNKPLDRIPRFSLIGLYGADVMQHKERAGSENSKLVLKQFDLFLGEFSSFLKEKGIFDKTYIVIAADHGMHDINVEIKLEELFKENGLKVKKTDLAREDADLFISERGVSSAHIYVKGDKLPPSKGVNSDPSYHNTGLDGRPTYDKMTNYPVKDGKTVNIIKLLSDEPNIDIVAARNGNNLVEVFSKDCHATIKKIFFGGEWYYGYQVHECDPLQYCDGKNDKQICNGNLYDDKTWLNETYNKTYPDGVVQFGQIFDDGRAGDIFLSSNKGGFFREKLATHGALIQADMNVPFMMRGPGIPKTEFGPVRTVDLYPTMLSWFGLEDDKNIDGEKINFSKKPAISTKDDTFIVNLEGFFLGKPLLYQWASSYYAEEEFKAFFQKERALFKNNTSVKELSDEIWKELLNRSASLGKLTNLEMDEKDLRYSLVNSQIERLRRSIQRLQDVKSLIQ